MFFASFSVSSLSVSMVVDVDIVVVDADVVVDVVVRWCRGLNHYDWG